jgi:PKD repeat protein
VRAPAVAAVLLGLLAGGAAAGTPTPALLTVEPPSGKAPLEVLFSLEAGVAKPAKWSLGFGDGTSPAHGPGKPPATVAHTYARKGSYNVTFSVEPGSSSLHAKVTVGGRTPPVLKLDAKPASGKAPLKVTFTTVENVPPRIESWKIAFGDGQLEFGQGVPPATTTHTFAKKGTYRARLYVVQHQRYGSVQYQTYADVSPG